MKEGGIFQDSLPACGVIQPKLTKQGKRIYCI